MRRIPTSSAIGQWLVHNVCPPTLSQVRAARDLGMDRKTWREFFEGKEVLVVLPPRNPGGKSIDVIMQLQNGRLRSYMFSIEDISGQGELGFLSFITKSRRLARTLNVNELEYGGMTVLNSRIAGMLDKFEFESLKQPIPEFLRMPGFETIDTFRKIEKVNRR